jgi:hypothetical protein
MSNNEKNNSGKYSSKRKNELNGNMPLIHSKKNKYIENQYDKYFNNIIYDFDYYTFNSLLSDEQETEGIPLENNKLFKVFIREISKDTDFKLLRLVNFIDLFKNYIDNGKHEEEDILYTYKTLFDITDNNILFCGDFYPINDIKESFSFIMNGFHPDLLKFFFEKIFGQYESKSNLIDYILKYARLNKKNTSGINLFTFNSLKELIDDISSRFHCNIIDTSKYTFHKWSLQPI